MRLALIAIITLGAVPTAAFAESAPSFEVLDRGTAVEVIAHNVTMSTTAITPIRSRLEVPLVGHPRADKTIATDATVKVVEFDGNEQRVLSVKTGFERTDVKALAKYAQASQVGADVHIIFPRIVPATGTAFVLPEPTIPAALAAKIAATPPAPVAAVTAPEIKPEAQPEPKIEAKTETKAEPRETKPATETKPVAATTAPASPEKRAEPATAAAPKEDAWQKLSMYGAVGLAAVGCGVWLLRRRKQQQGVVSTIDVIAQKSLGGKAKIVWFTAGGREMVVAVTPQAVRMLGQWKKTAGTDNVAFSALPAAQTYNEGGRVDARAEKGASSAAVDGILKLRERRSMTNIPMPMVSDEVATGDVDADEQWAKEILAATGARR